MGKTLADQALERLREDLLSGHLAPGSRLKVGDLQRQYGFGLSPLREALTRLATEGLAVAVGQRGFSAASLSLGELLDLTRTRERLETLALRDAIARGDADWEADILAAFHRLARAPLPKAAREAAVASAWEAKHRAFHQTLVAACDSPWLLRFHSQLVERTERYRRVRLFHSPPAVPLARDVEKEHEAIMKAILARDAEHACALVVVHLRRTAQTVQAYWAGSA